jgi:hypothetical protein
LSDVAGVDVPVLLGDGGEDGEAQLDKGNSMTKSRRRGAVVRRKLLAGKPLAYVLTVEDCTVAVVHQKLRIKI